MAKGDLRASPDEIGVFLCCVCSVWGCYAVLEGNKKEAMCYGLLGVCAAINR